jgi:hypothetical protein
MATYLDRYLRGEHERVWGELVALGTRVREPAIYTDAEAVARETMRRARANVERIVDRLRGMNFHFANPDAVFVPPAPGIADVLGNLERRIGPLPIALRAFYETVGSVSLVGSYPGLSTYVKPADPRARLSACRAIYERHIGPLPLFPPPNAAGGPPTADPVAQLKAAGIVLPPESVELMQETARLRQAFADLARGPVNEGGRVGSDGIGPSERDERRHQLALDLYRHMTRKSEKKSATPPVVSDPLVVEPLRGDDAEAYRYFGSDDNGESDEDGWGGRYAVDVAPDAIHKSGYSGGGPYQILLPNAAADAPLLDSEYPTFVAYLRASFRWGGFPGLGRYPIPTELARLTEGLEPM